MKKLLILSVLLTGCAQYYEPGTGTYGVPIYPPTYDVQPMRNIANAGIVEAQKLRQFVGNDNNLIKLRWALESYESSSRDLIYAINTAQGATITYTPWQMQNYTWHRN